ncbi:MAG: metal-binding protein [Elainellaceae cyanobacterium]
MPSGKTHDRITLWSLPLVAGLTLVRTRSSSLTLVVLAGYLFGALMLGPDLDTRSIHYKRWGVLRWIWIPYRGSLKHRSILSHGPFVGTLLRVIYVLAWGFVLGMGAIAIANDLLQWGWTWNDISTFLVTFIEQNPISWVALLIGLELGAFSHYLADWGVSSYKRVRKHYPKEGLRALRLIAGTPTRKRKSRKKKK